MMLKKWFSTILCCAQDDACGTNGEERAVGDDPPLAPLYLDVVDEGACIAVVVGEGVAQVSMPVATDVDGAVVQVDAGVNGFKGCVNGISFLIAADDVVAHVQGDFLLVVKHVLDDDDSAKLL